MQVECVLDQRGVLPRAAHLAQDALRAGRSVERRPALAQPRTVRERVGERREVDHVIGVQVREHDGVDQLVSVVHAQLGEDAGAAVDQEAKPVAKACEIAGAGAVAVLPRGALAENCESD